MDHPEVSRSMLMRLQSVIIRCSDLPRSVEFYRDRLGFPVKRQFADRTEFHCGPVTLVLRADETAPDSPRPVAATPPASPASFPGQAQLSFEVLNLDAYYSEMKEKGVEFALPPTLQDFRRKLALLRDPDGLPIAVFQEVR